MAVDIPAQEPNLELDCRLRAKSDESPPIKKTVADPNITSHK
jgi:hypothetical protein